MKNLDIPEGKKKWNNSGALYQKYEVNKGGKKGGILSLLIY